MTFHPEDGDCEKLFGLYLKKRKNFSATYSTNKSINSVGGRILYAAICNSVGLNPNFNATGCFIWHHNWGDKPRCFHGEKMHQKVNEIEMSPTSDAGIQALKEGRGIIVSNKYNKQMVKVTQPNYMFCCEDGGKFGQTSSRSCGLSFTDGNKALIALKNAIGTAEAVFPKAASLSSVLFILGNCDCTYTGKIIMGKQLPKMTPFTIPGTEGLDDLDIGKVQSVAVKYPATFVFQCANAQLGTKRNCGARFCEFKISHTDMIQVLCKVKKLWYEVFNETMSLQFPKFKWDPCFQVKNAILPEIEENMDESPFGEIIPPLPKKRKIIESSDSESE